LATKTTLLSVSVLIEQQEDEAHRIRWESGAEEEVQKAVLTAIAVLLRNRPDVSVKWEGSCEVPLDGKPCFGRCVVCNRWVHDYYNEDSVLGADSVCRGAQVEGQFRCDEHLPSGHPLCFAGRGYDGPIPFSNDWAGEQMP
jgi:hypothetical protein